MVIQINKFIIIIVEIFFNLISKKYDITKKNNSYINKFEINIKVIAAPSGVYNDLFVLPV